MYYVFIQTEEDGRKKGENNYTLDILLLSLMMILFTYETVCIYTVIITLLSISFHLFFAELHKRKSKVVKKVRIERTELPIGFYMCAANIFMLLVTNFAIFY